jgi:hypothetical protein
MTMFAGSKCETRSSMSGKHKTLALSWLAIAISGELTDIAWKFALRTSAASRPPMLLKTLLLVPLALSAREYVRAFVVALIAFSCGN